MTERDLREKLLIDASLTDSFVNIGSYTKAEEQPYEFQELHVSVNENAERFWGVNLRSSDGFMEHGDGLSQRLLVLKKIIKVVPTNKLTSSGIDPALTSMPANKLTKIADRNEKLVVRDPLSDKERKPALHKSYPNAQKLI
jgi:hypothetical protein